MAVTIRIPNTNPAAFDQLQVRSKALIDIDLTRATMNPATGQEPTFTRAATRTASDAYGTTYTVGNGRPAWSYSGGNLGLLSGTTDVLWYPFPRAIREMSGLVRFVNQGILGSSGHWINAIGAVAPLFRLEVGSSSTVIARLTNSAAASSTATSATSLATAGQLVQLWWAIEFDGSNMRSVLRTKVGTGSWSARIEGSLIAKGTLLFGVSGSETLSRYYVTRAE
jgi:hypothetical protein